MLKITWKILFWTCTKLLFETCYSEKCFKQTCNETLLNVYQMHMNVCERESERKRIIEMGRQGDVGMFDNS